MGLKIDTNAKLIYLDDKPLELTKTEYNILVLFLTNKNKIFSREEIIKEVWKKSVSLRAVDTAISRIRKKLVKYNIVSRIGFGYGFMDT